MAASDFPSDRSPVAVALLARPGPARERLREALVAAGAELVLEDEPAAIDATTLLQAAPQAVMIALEPAIEEALEPLEAALETPGLTVIYDEAELAAQRDGWAAQRWIRHLLAKLHGSDDVLPPGCEPDAAASTAVADATESPVSASVPAAFDFHPSDGFLAPNPDREVAPSLEELLAQSIPARSPETPEAAPVPAVAPPPPAGTEATTGTGDAADQDAGPAWQQWSLADPAAEAAPTPPPTPVHEPLAGISVEGLSLADPDAPLPMSSSAPTAPRTSSLPSVDDPLAGLSFADLTLADVDAPAPAEQIPLPVWPQMPPASPATDPLAGLSLVDPTAEEGRAPTLPPGPGGDQVATTSRPDEGAATQRPAGAVLLLAGLGGPDAVRRVLMALPSDFPRPVLVCLHLNGGQYANLVHQISRVSALPITLASAGQTLRPGHAYVLDDDTTLAASAGELVFTAGADRSAMLAALPADDSAVLLLSGADPAWVAPVQALARAGALVAGQGGDGCYDPAAADRLAATGAAQGVPARLAALLHERWPL